MAVIEVVGIGMSVVMGMIVVTGMLRGYCTLPQILVKPARHYGGTVYKFCRFC